MPRPKKNDSVWGKPLWQSFGADPAHHRDGMTASFEHINRVIKALLENLRDRRLDSGAGGDALVSVEHTFVRQISDSGKFVNREIFF